MKKSYIANKYQIGAKGQKHSIGERGTCTY